MKKIFSRSFFIISFLTVLFLGVASGLYLLMKVRYASYPEEVYRFEGGTPTTGQFLTIMFYDEQRMTGFTFVALIIAAIFRIVNVQFLKNRRWIFTPLTLTMSFTFVYLLYRLLPLFDFDRDYVSIYMGELKDELIFMVTLYLIFSFFLALLVTRAVPEGENVEESTKGLNG